VKRGLPAHPGSSFHAVVLLIHVRCDRSPLHGLGLFAVSPIPAGTPIWRFTPGFDQWFTPRQLHQLPEPAQRHVQHYGYFDVHADHWVLNGDLSIFMNHSSSPNTGAPARITGAAPETVALRDLLAGEEITCDYHAFDGSQKPIPPLHPPV
jgi:SET domain-containing protein